MGEPSLLSLWGELWNRKRYVESHRIIGLTVPKLGYLSSALRAIKTEFLMPFV